MKNRKRKILVTICQDQKNPELYYFVFRHSKNLASWVILFPSIHIDEEIYKKIPDSIRVSDKDLIGDDTIVNADKICEMHHKDSLGEIEAILYLAKMSPVREDLPVFSLDTILMHDKASLLTKKIAKKIQSMSTVAMAV